MANGRNNTKREPLRVTAQRDKNRCGIHVGGCGQIVQPGDGNQDHIVPLAFFRHLGPDRTSADYHGSWNLQLMHRSCNASLGGHVHGWPNYQCSCHYLHIVGNDLCVATRVPLTAGSKTEHHILFRDFVVQAAQGHSKGVGLFLNPIGPAARVDPPRNREQVTGNKNVQYMILINPSMVAEFNDSQKRRADSAMLLGKRVRGGGSANERGTMYPFADLPDIALSRAG